jgi:uncharacterized protein with PQ loop repeat
MFLEKVPVLAGMFSTMIFMSGTLSMLLKTWRTKDVDSYSLLSLILNNIGNIVYWVYILSLPVGPIYLLHGFYTLATVLMLVGYFLYRHRPEAIERISQTLKRITTTQTKLAVQVDAKRHTQEIPHLHLRLDTQSDAGE